MSDNFIGALKDWSIGAWAHCARSEVGLKKFQRKVKKWYFLRKLGLFSKRFYALDSV